LRPPSRPVAIVVADIVAVSGIVAASIVVAVAVLGVVTTSVVVSASNVAAVIIVVARPLALSAGIIVDAGNLHRTAIGIDANGLPAIVEVVLGLRGAARQQKRGDSQKLLHNDLLCRESELPKLHKGSS
jgi:hypothetical protein